MRMRKALKSRLFSAFLSISLYSGSSANQVSSSRATFTREHSVREPSLRTVARSFGLSSWLVLVHYLPTASYDRSSGEKETVDHEDGQKRNKAGDAV